RDPVPVEIQVEVRGGKAFFKEPVRPNGPLLQLDHRGVLEQLCRIDKGVVRLAPQQIEYRIDGHQLVPVDLDLRILGEDVIRGEGECNGTEQKYKGSHHGL